MPLQVCFRQIFQGYDQLPKCRKYADICIYGVSIYHVEILWSLDSYLISRYLGPWGCVIMYMYIYIHTDIYMYIHIHMYICIYTYVCIHIYIYMVYKHTRTLRPQYHYQHRSVVYLRVMMLLRRLQYMRTYADQRQHAGAGCFVRTCTSNPRRFIFCLEKILRARYSMSCTVARAELVYSGEDLSMFLLGLNLIRTGVGIWFP